MEDADGGATTQSERYWWKKDAAIASGLSEIRCCWPEYPILSLLIDFKRTGEMSKSLVLGCVAATATAGGWIDEWMAGRWKAKKNENKNWKHFWKVAHFFKLHFFLPPFHRKKLKINMRNKEICKEKDKQVKIVFLIWKVQKIKRKTDCAERRRANEKRQANEFLVKSIFLV